MGLNGPVLDMIDEGFAVSQVMAIRRLSDPNFYDPKKAVISLRRIIDDIADSLNVFSRENYICFEGTKYQGLTHEKDGINWMHWDRKQKYFDRLAGVPKTDRSRNDKIDKRIIASLISDLNKCNDLRTYANKFVAHTSDHSGKAKLTDRQKGITLNNLDDTYKVITKCASFVGAVILYEHELGKIPVPQYNQFENLDKPVVTSNDLPKLGAYWQNREKHVNSWVNEFWPST